MENGRLNHARDIGRVGCGPGLFGCSSEADLIIYDQVDGAARRIAFQLGEIERLRHHALSGKSRISVDQHRDHSLALGIAQPVLLGSRDPFDYRIYRFQMAGIESYRHY